MISTISRFKTGECATCGAKGDVVKIKKETYCLSCNKNIKAHQQIERAKERNAVRGLNTYQKENGFIDNQQELIIDLDRLVSRFVRLSAAEADLKITCYTCGYRVLWTKAHCSHFINRQHLATRWLLKNLKAACANCNVTLRGNLKAYSERLEREEKGQVEFLTELGHTIEKPSLNELKEMIFDFQQKVNILEKAKGIK